MKRLLNCIAGLACAAMFVTTPALADDALKASIAGAQRTPANVARDGARHPYETLQFFGLRQNMTVVELSPGGGWYTEILAPYLRGQGRLVAASYDPASGTGYFARNAKAFADKLAADAAVYDKVSVTVFEPPAKLDMGEPGSADLVLTFRNAHNWVQFGEDNVRAVFARAFATLKSGGIFGIVDHRLPAGRTQDAKASSGYVHETYVIAMAESVGFKLAGASDINANPKDTADHPKGVWTLPPTYALKEVDRANYEAIGESDRFTLKFRKP
jgi:predicted methyltransferase